ALVINGGTLSLTRGNTYSGGTTINNAAVTLGAPFFGAPPPSLGADGNNLTMTGTSSLDLNGNHLGAGALSGEAGATITSNREGPIIITAGDATDTTFAGRILNGSGT